MATKPLCVNCGRPIRFGDLHKSESGLPTHNYSCSPEDDAKGFNVVWTFDDDETWATYRRLTS